MVAQKYELSVISLQQHRLRLSFEYPVTSQVVNATSAQPQPPVSLGSNKCLRASVFPEKEQQKKKKAFFSRLTENKQDRKDEA